VDEKLEFNMDIIMLSFVKYMNVQLMMEKSHNANVNKVVLKVILIT